MKLPSSQELQISTQDLQCLISETKEILLDNINYPKKFRLSNYFKKLSPSLIERVSSMISHFDEYKDLKWHYEIFHSVEPVGFHNDRNFFPEHNERCDRGLIIPLEWSSSVPHTIFYDLFYEDKVNWDGQGFSTLDGEKKEFPQEALGEGFPAAWETKKVLFFDSLQVHNASSFGKKLDDYKLSINGLGYSQHFKNT